MDLARTQALIAAQGFDGWLLYDFHNRDPLAYRVLGLSGAQTTTRRWFVWLPREGEPVNVRSAVEEHRIDGAPGRKVVYRSLVELKAALGTFLKPGLKVAMQYSPQNDIPYVSLVDAGTVEMVRSYGVEVVSSAELIQALEAVVDEDGYRLHKDAGVIIDGIRRAAFDEIAARLKAGLPCDEVGMRRWIVDRFTDHKMTCDGGEPIVAVNDHAADPHFEPTPENSRPIRPGDAVLIDLWARFDRADGIYYDITWCGHVGAEPTPKHKELFDLIMKARDACVTFIQERFASGRGCAGWEADDACRKVIEDAGYGRYFVHRTGHSIGREVHGNGVNLDHLETRDSRRLGPGICCSIEPGIYLPGEIGVRTEINVFIRHDGTAEVTGEVQHRLVKIDL